MTNIKWADDKEIEQYQKELEEVCSILHQDLLFVSDEAPLTFNQESSHFLINKSSFKYNLLKLTIAFNLDFSKIIIQNNMPDLIEVLKHIRKNRPSSTLQDIPEHLKHWGQVESIKNNRPEKTDDQFINLGWIIIYKEQLDYHRGLSLTDEAFAKSNWKTDFKYDDFLKEGSYTLTFSDGSTKEFSNQEEIYYFVLASCSNDPKFIYSAENLN